MQQLLHLKREEACTVMCKACFSSEEMWARMAKWQETGFKPTVSTMNTYVSMLMIHIGRKKDHLLQHRYRTRYS